MGKATSAIGERGVIKVIDELLARGFSPYRPIVDDGVDLMLSSGIKIQVKAANLTYHSKKLDGTPHYFYQKENDDVATFAGVIN